MAERVTGNPKFLRNVSTDASSASVAMLRTLRSVTRNTFRSLPYPHRGGQESLGGALHRGVRVVTIASQCCSSMDFRRALPMQRETPIQIAGYPASPVDFTHGAVAVSLYRVSRLEDHVDRESLLRDDRTVEPPYWAHLWVGAIALARRLAESNAL